MLANSLSLLRMGLVPVLLWSLHRDDSGLSSLSAALLISAAATDWLDGAVARRLGQVSQLGRILDPLADKLLVGSLGIALVYWRGFPLWLVVLQLFRDTAIVAVGLFLLRSRAVVLAASRAGKLATASMLLTIFSYLFDLGEVLQVLAAAATAALILFSSVGYGRSLRQVLGTPAPSPGRLEGSGVG